MAALVSPAADIPALLWDIARLRAAALRTDQYLRVLGPRASADAVGCMLRAELDELACIRELEAMRLDIERPKEE